MTTALDGHIAIDDRGTARIAGHRIRVVDLVCESQANNWGPEELHEQFPHLTRGQIHAALTYYYDHQAELDAQIERELREVDALRAAAGESPFVKRMRAEGRLP